MRAYSFIASAPTQVYIAFAGKAAITQHMHAPREFDTADPLADLEKLLPKRRYYHDERLPGFTGGLVGYAGYDTIRYYEGEKLNAPPPDDRRLPDVMFGLYNELVVFDHVDKTIKVIANADLSAHAVAAGEKAARARHIPPPWLKLRTGMRATVLMVLCNRLQQPTTRAIGEIDPRGPLELKFSSNMTREQYEDAVRKGKEYIKAGDIFQFVPSQRLRREQLGRSVRCVSGAADHQPLAIHVFPQVAALLADRVEPGDSLPGRGRQSDDPPACRHAPARRDAGGG